MLKSLASLIQDGHRDPSFEFLALIRNWSQIVGEKMAKSTLPLKNQRSTLVILTNHPGYSHELNFLQTMLRDKITTYFPSLKKSIQNIRFQYDPTFFKKKDHRLKLKQMAEKKAPTGQNDNPLLLKLHPYSPEYKRLKKEADESLKDITNLEIKKILTSLYFQCHNRLGPDNEP